MKKVFLTPEETKQLLKMQQDILNALKMAGASEEDAKDIVKKAKIIVETENEQKEIIFQ